MRENTFYETGSETAARIEKLCEQVSFEDLSSLILSVRNELKLRHIPLFLCCQLIKLHRKNPIVSEVIAQTIQRPDELCEIVKMYWSKGKRPLSSQLKKGLAKAFLKFSEYSLAKYDRKDEIKLRDVLFLCHAKAVAEKDALFKRLIDGKLETPDTWEVALSAGSNKKETWERLLQEKKLGYDALLKNLRNMEEANVDPSVVEEALLSGAAKNKALPFRFIAAALAAPRFATTLSTAMLAAIDHEKTLPGRTALLIDISGSMDDKISVKSTINRWQAAAALGILLREICPQTRIFTFSSLLQEIPNYHGMALLKYIDDSQIHGGTYTARALQRLKDENPFSFDRIIIVTDEQSADGSIPCWTPRGYVVNVATYRNGLELYNKDGWIRVNGWSERIIDWIRLHEEQSEV
jgi:hypothetical protein